MYKKYCKGEKNCVKAPKNMSPVSFLLKSPEAHRIELLLLNYVFIQQFFFTRQRFVLRLRTSFFILILYV